MNNRPVYIKVIEGDRSSLICSSPAGPVQLDYVPVSGGIDGIKYSAHPDVVE